MPEPGGGGPYSQEVLVARDPGVRLHDLMYTCQAWDKFCEACWNSQCRSELVQALGHRRAALRASLSLSRCNLRRSV